jgi:hypothetical protein
LAKSEVEERWERSPGYVYFIGASNPVVAVKIGISTQKDIGRRLSTHQGSNHEPLSILGILPIEIGERPMLSAEKLERQLHKKFAHLQRFKNGWAGSEWFTAAPELMDFIEKECLTPEKRLLKRSIAKPGPGLSNNVEQMHEPATDAKL